MKKINNNCSRTELWASPADWETTTAKSSLRKSWSIQCEYYDTAHKKKYPKGFLYRRKVNKFKTIEERRAAIRFFMNEIPKLLDEKLFNPITKKYMVPDVVTILPGVLSPKLNFIEALRINYVNQEVSAGVKKEIRRIINNVEGSAHRLKIQFPISEMHSGHVRDLLDNLSLTPNEYNKYLTHLSIVLSDLVEKRMLLHNPIRDIKKKKTVKKIRETFELNEIEQIFDYLQINHPEFYRYGMIFFHSASRTSEMFRLQAKDVYLHKQEFRLTIQKGSHHKEVKRPILRNVISFWADLMKNCKNPNDFIFGRGLNPSGTPIQPYQITKRFKRLVKDKLVFKNGELIRRDELEPYDRNYRLITADFYSLKHKFMDELDRISNLAGFMAGHTTDVTERFYVTGREDRKIDALKKIDVNFIYAQ